MSPRTSLLPLAAVAAVLAVAAAPARGDQRIDYAVTVEGTIDYNRADVDGDAALQHDETVDFRPHVPKLAFFGTAAQVTAPALGTATIRRSAFTMTGESGSFGCPEPGETRVRLRFDRKDRRAIRRAGKVKLALAVATAGQEVKRGDVLRTTR